MDQTAHEARSAVGHEAPGHAMVTPVKKSYPRVAAFSIAMSVTFMLALIAAYFRTGSMLALTQAADSIVDVLTSSALLVSLYVSARPADHNHPRGHHRAEPIAALVAAVLAGILAMEVLRAAIEALLEGAKPNLHAYVAAAFAMKLVGKLGIVIAARRLDKAAHSPALRALAMDARNDVLVCSVAIVGFVAARYKWPAWDAWLAIPMAAWIGWSGVTLALENIRLLMGEAAPAERQADLRVLVENTPQVRQSHGWRVRYEGVGLDVHVSILLDEALSLRAAHDIGEEVERRLLAQPDVVSATVHIDVDAPS